MKDLLLKTTFIIVRIVFESINNDAKTTKNDDVIVFLQIQNQYK